MNKRAIHHLWTLIRPVKTTYLLVAFLVCALVCLGAMRANNTGMVDRRNAVFVADEHNTDVEKALQELRLYVGQHMNTDLYNGKGVFPPIQLKYTYERLVQAEQDRVNNTNSKIYTDAQKHCEKADPNSILGRSRVPCIQAYIKSHSGQTVRPISDVLYKFDFVSPRWSPDLAGWSLVLSGLLLVLAALRFALGKLLPALTK